MGDLWLFLFDVAVLFSLVTTYLRLRGRFARVAATVSEERTEPAGMATEGGRVTRVSGVVRGRWLQSMFAVVEIDADTLYIRSRPKWLGLAILVPRRDVDQARVATGKSGLPTFFTFVPVPGRAVGLDGLRLLLRRDPVGFRRQLGRLGWLAGPDALEADPDATLGSAG
jgi:hypothetical protein